MKSLPIKTVERLVLYKRILQDLLDEGKSHIFSHDIARLVKNTSPQVRRDFMLIGYSGSPSKGYAIEDLIAKIRSILQKPDPHKIALIGVGNLGRAILAYFSSRHPRLSIEAAFDTDHAKVDRVIAGCRVYNMADLEQVVSDVGITMGIITVPSQFAQDAADQLIHAGIRAILNFAPVKLHLPDTVVQDELDITMKLEKLAYLIN